MYLRSNLNDVTGDKGVEVHYSLTLSSLPSSSGLESLGSSSAVEKALGNHFGPLALLSHFPQQSCVDAWEKGCWQSCGDVYEVIRNEVANLRTCELEVAGMNSS